MYHVPGVQLSSCWDKMSSTEHLQIIKSISDTMAQMAALEFPAFGRIYFEDAPIDSALKIDLGDGFCIGPHCNPVLWNRRPGESDLYGNSGRNHGPCKFSIERYHCHPKLTHLPRAESTGVLRWTISIGPFSHTV